MAFFRNCQKRSANRFNLAISRLSAVLCTTSVMLLCVGSVARADPVYEFTFDQSNYTVAPGGTVYVTVYLQETPGTGTSVLDANGVGMFGAGVTVFDIAPLPPEPAQVLAAAGIALNPGFNDTSSARKGVANSPSILAYLSEVTDATVFVHADDPTPGRAHYLMTVGTFQYTAGTTPGITFLQTGNNPLVVGDVNITALGNALDSFIVHTGATITTTPEPSALVLAGMAVLSLGAFHCVRRRNGRRLK